MASTEASAMGPAAKVRIVSKASDDNKTGSVAEPLFAPALGPTRKKAK